MKSFKDRMNRFSAGSGSPEMTTKYSLEMTMPSDYFVARIAGEKRIFCEIFHTKDALRDLSGGKFSSSLRKHDLFMAIRDQVEGYFS